MPTWKNHSELELAALLRQGNEEAFVEIYRRNWRRMYNAAFKRLGDESLCEDLVQNVFTDLWERRGESDIENLPAYLNTAVKFQVIKHSSRSRKAMPITDGFDALLVSPFKSDDPVEETETLELVRLWIASLPEKRREIFLLYYTEELSSGRIAELLGISRKTVQNQITTATHQIREQLSRILFVSLLLAGMLIRGDFDA